MKLNRLTFAAFAVAAIVALGSSLAAYDFYGPGWRSLPVPVYVNPSTPDLDAASVEAAMRVAMDEWSYHSGSRFQWVYAGRSNDTSTSQDGRNVILFRNASNGSAIATTYAWWSGTDRIDTDIVFWDASFTFFSGTTGCGGGGAYIEDIAAHELGHALGLHHSTAGDATMYPYYSYCAQDMRTLAADDMAGAQAIYGRATTNPEPNPAPEPEPTPAPTPTPAPSGGPVLTADGFKVKGFQFAQLDWSGLSSSSVTIHRSGSVMTTANDGSEVDAINVKGKGTYRYKVCEAGTSTCTNEVTVQF